MCRHSEGLADLGNTVAEANVPQFSYQGNVLRKQILLLGKKMFLPEVKNIFDSRTQTLLSKHAFPSLATMKTMLTR